MSATRYYVVSWVDPRPTRRASDRRTREYGAASTKQAAIRFAERVLPPDAEFIVTTRTKTVHHGRTPPAGRVARQRR